MPIDVDVASGYGGVKAQQEAEADKGVLDRAIVNFQKQIGAFVDNMRGLRAQRNFINNHPELAPEYDTLLGRGEFIQTQISRAQKLVAAARSIFDTVKGWFGLGELGALPAVPVAIAAVAGAGALITKWLADVYVFSKKIETIKQAEAAGGRVSPQMQKILETGTGPGLLDVLQRNVIWIVIGGTLLLFGPEIMKMIRRMR